MIFAEKSGFARQFPTAIWFFVYCRKYRGMAKMARLIAVSGTGAPAFVKQMAMPY